MAEKLKEAFDKYGDPNGTPMTLDDIVDAMDLEYRRANGFAPRRIKIDLTDQEIAYFLERKDQFPGLDIVEESIRHYDEDRVAVQTIGYLRKFSSTLDVSWYDSVRETMAAENKDPGLEYTAEEFVGFDGLEMQYQHELRGKNGYKAFPLTRETWRRAFRS